MAGEKKPYLDINLAVQALLDVPNAKPINLQDTEAYDIVIQLVEATLNLLRNRQRTVSPKIAEEQNYAGWIGVAESMRFALLSAKHNNVPLQKALGDIQALVDKFNSVTQKKLN